MKFKRLLVICLGYIDLSKAAVFVSRGIEVIARLGLAFKVDIDDLRESPELDIVKHLAEKGVCRVLAVEPNIQQLSAKLASADVELTTLEQANVVVVLVDHKQFKSCDKSLFLSTVMIDTRGVV